MFKIKLSHTLELSDNENAGDCNCEYKSYNTAKQPNSHFDSQVFHKGASFGIPYN